jgi:hypothetical protein
MNQGMPQMGKGQQMAGMTFGQPGGQPRGKSPDNMNEIMALARRMSDAQLADVLNGRSMDIPQYAAMAEAMGRKSLRTAVMGAQATAQARQPSVKDRLLAGAMPAAGLDQLPAPNMGTVDMADGGIVAFNGERNEQLVESNPELERIQRRAQVLGMPNIFTPNIGPYDAYQKLIGEPFSRFFSMSPREQAVAFQKGKEARTGERDTFTSSPTDITKDTKAMAAARQKDVAEVKDAQTKRDMKAAGVTPMDIEQAEIGLAMQQMLNQKDQKGDTKAAERRQELAGGAGTRTGAPGLSPEKRVNPFGQLSAEVPDYEKIKRQGLGEGLMALSGALFAKPTLGQALSQGLPTLAAISGATRKETREAQKDYKAYQLNLAKANELFEQGQEDKAFKYYKQAQDHLYQMENVAAQKMAANRPSSELQVLQALKYPKEDINETYARVFSMRQDPKQDQALMARYSQDPLRFTMSYDEWIAKNFPNYKSSSVAGVGQPAYSRGVFDINGRQVQ